MAQQIRLFRWLVLAILLTGTVIAQTATGPRFVVKQEKATENAVMVGTVQLFSHAAITVQDRHNPYKLQTFSIPPNLREKYRDRHLDYGDHIKVKYRLQGGQAVALHAHWRKGS